MGRLTLAALALLGALACAEGRVDSGFEPEEGVDGGDTEPTGSGVPTFVLDEERFDELYASTAIALEGRVVDEGGGEPGFFGYSCRASLNVRTRPR
ncbi:MAG: hypothetical protein O7J95_01750 [Planctomycetota bacterium]|nr:hypothetical protein [Planctomycetota bacterium]